MKILIAEDDPVTQTSLRLTLKKFGHTTHVVDSGLDALDVVTADYFPVIITDFQMPGLDGMELTKVIRTRPQDQYTYVIMLSALSSRQNYLDAVLAGVDDFLAKPLDSVLLAARLHVAERIVGLQNHVRCLESLMSVCSYCKKVREGNNWVDLQSHVTKTYGTRPSHGICPSCLNTQVKPQMEALGISMDDFPI